MVIENDTHTFINGTLKLQKAIASPLFVHTHTEHYEKGKWLLQAYTRDYQDFCMEFHNKAAPWYYITKDFPKCPIPAGVGLEILFKTSFNFLLFLDRVCFQNGAD